MDRLVHKRKTAQLRKNRTKATVRGTTTRPRLSVKISHLNVSAQIIDDIKQTTLVSATSVGISKIKGTMTEKSVAVGSEIAKKAIAKKITQVVFDRGGKLYHGKIKSLAEAARERGLKF